MDLVQAREQKRQRTVTDRPDTERVAPGVLVTDDDRDDDEEEDIEGDYDCYDSRVAHMERFPDHRDEIDYIVVEMDKQRAGNYLFGKILARNYRSEFISFYNRDSNNCELLDEKAVATLYSPYRILQFCDEVDIYLDLSTKDSEQSEERGVGRGMVSWRCLDMRPGIFSDLVRGKHGVTRVTYAVIFGAVEAVVAIKISSRSVKNLPVKEEGQKLKIRVILGNDEMGKISRSASFNPKLSSRDTTNDKGSKYGTLQVKVAWSAVPLFPDRYLKKLHDAKQPSSV
ncbi:hypothetical protein EJB05_17525 [Eragrostis curvula]|uniref:DUF6598 domain-containing protein n=1 Tax=Eragrostis curvula TaxID=38414 RepID=A0A5J9VI88_9POAL|nr:hypothetical protein EJB05_17525 [Eragrostis curvula]